MATPLWTWKMAWRDSRSSRRKLLLFVSSITLGVAALVAVGAFGANLRDAVDEQAKTLLGADLVLRGSRPFPPELEDLLAGLPAEASSRQISTATMAFFPLNSGTRLVQLRALKGGFPYYGELETVPPEAATSYQEGDFALVDDGLMIQMEAQLGDPLRIGNKLLTIKGRLMQIPGEAPIANMTGPRIYIPYGAMDETGLIQPGSRVGYRVFFKLAAGVDAPELEEQLRPRLREFLIRSETVKDRKESLGNVLANLYRFLNLAAFMALLLGGIGVAGSIHFYLKQKVPVVAVLRCLGADAKQTFAVYLIQAGMLGALGALAGGTLGVGVQFLIPVLLADFLPVETEVGVSWLALGEGMALGLGISLLFALLPLLPIRRITPLLTLRREFEPQPPGRRDGLRILILGLAIVVVVGFAVFHSGGIVSGLAFSGGLAVVLLILAATARLLMYLAKRFTPAWWTYVWRQGLANIYRPQNQTGAMLPVLGLGTFLILTLYLVQVSLIGEVRALSGRESPNLIFYDVQSDQVEEVAETLRSLGLPILQRVPIVTMRLASINGDDTRALAEEDDSGRPRWALRREYRSTYRDRLNDAEEVLEGEWIGEINPDSGAVPVSVEEGIARSLDLKIGDELAFDVQGVPVEAHVGSIRRLEWRRFQPGFFMVFPKGVLEPAPQFHVLVTRTESAEVSGRAQREVVAHYPNVSAIDLDLILRAVDGILDKAALVIQFMALFSVGTGLIVLAGAVAAGRYQRIRESVLLRTLGASRRQIRGILMLEYVLLGTFAALSGLLPALAAGWALTVWIFQVDYNPPAWPFAVGLFLTASLTALVGILNSRGVSTRPPLEVLRAE